MNVYKSIHRPVLFFWCGYAEDGEYKTSKNNMESSNTHEEQNRQLHTWDATIKEITKTLKERQLVMWKKKTMNKKEWVKFVYETSE